MKLAVHRHCETLYAAIDKASKDETIGETTFRVFRGSVTDLFAETGIPKTYYSETMGHLMRHLNVEQIQRGTKGRDTVLVVRRPPDRNDFVMTGEKDLTDAEEFAMLVTEFEEFKKTLGGVNIAEALVEIDKRFTEVSERLGNIENKIAQQGE